MSAERKQEASITMNSVKPSEFATILKASYKNRNPKYIILGQPGCGKTSICYQVAKELVNETETNKLREKEKKETKEVIGVPRFTFQATLYDPTEIKGLPIYDHQEKIAKFLPFEDMPSMEEGLLIIDDLPHAPTQTQNAFMRLILEGIAGAWNLGGLYPIATGNRATDKAGARDLQTAMANRFCFLNLEVSYEDWRNWAIVKGVHPAIIAFLGRPEYKDLLNTFDAGQQINATPRSWEAASQTMYNLEKVSSSLMRTAMCGCIGDAAVSKFNAWRKYYDKMPDLQKILAGENIYPDELDVMYATISGLIAISKDMLKKKGVIQRLIDYAVKMPQNFSELGALLSKDLLLVAGQDAFMNANLEKWADRYPDLIVGES